MCITEKRKKNLIKLSLTLAEPQAFLLCEETNSLFIHYLSASGAKDMESKSDMNCPWRISLP